MPLVVRIVLLSLLAAPGIMRAQGVVLTLVPEVVRLRGSRMYEGPIAVRESLGIFSSTYFPRGYARMTAGILGGARLEVAPRRGAGVSSWSGYLGYVGGGTEYHSSAGDAVRGVHLRRSSARVRMLSLGLGRRWPSGWSRLDIDGSAGITLLALRAKPVSYEPGPGQVIDLGPAVRDYRSPGGEMGVELAGRLWRDASLRLGATVAAVFNDTERMAGDVSSMGRPADLVQRVTIATLHAGLALRI